MKGVSKGHNYANTHKASGLFRCKGYIRHYQEVIKTFKM